jgi:hypothetical protein
MARAARPTKARQADLFEADAARTLLDHLLSESKLYTRSADYKNLLDFVTRLRNFAPFNAMLLQMQKPGLLHAASARDWRERFGRTLKHDARPLLILWPFGPVTLVYDLIDTEGQDVPEDAFAFPARGDMNATRMAGFVKLVEKVGIAWDWIDAGDGKAGSITPCPGPTMAGQKAWLRYRMAINKNHPPAVQFTTLAHELGHLFLGHLGKDTALQIPMRRHLTLRQREVEAESVAYIVCERNGVTTKSQSYLANHVEQTTTVKDIELYQVLRAAGRVEELLGLTIKASFDRPPKLRSRPA